MTVLQWNVVKRTAFTCKVAVYSIDTGSLLLLQLIILIKTKSSKAMEFLVFSKRKIQKFVKCLNNFFLRYVSRWSKKKNTLHLTNTRWADLKSFAWNVDTRLVRLSVGLGLLFCRICHRFVSALEWLSMATVRNNSQFKYALNYRSLNCSVVVVNPHTLPCSSHSPIAVNCLRHIAFLILSTNLFPFSHSCVFFFSLIRGHL